MPIPHTIHYCWLSDTPLSPFAAHCLGEWQKRYPHFKFKKWDKQAFDITSVPWVEEAYAAKKYAFSSDYIRAYALYTEGGIYLDLDVIIKKDIVPLLDDEFVSFVECYYNDDGCRIGDGVVQAAFIASAPGHPLVKSILDTYTGRHFPTNPDEMGEVLSPILYAQRARQYGFRPVDEEQRLEGGIHIWPSKFCAPNPRTVTPEAYAVHFCEHSWSKKGFWSDAAKKFRTLMRTLRMKVWGD